MVFTDTDYKLFTIGAKFKSKGFRALSEIIDMVEEKLNKKEVVNMSKLYYDINEEDLRDNNVKSEEELDLPRTMELKLYDLESEDEDDIEDAIKSEIEFMTDFIVDEFTYEIIKKY